MEWVLELNVGRLLHCRQQLLFGNLYISCTSLQTRYIILIPSIGFLYERFHLVHRVNDAQVCDAEKELRSPESDRNVASPCLSNYFLCLRSLLDLLLNDVRSHFRLCQRRYQHLPGKNT